MLLGHYAVALAAKRVAPRTSLGTLVLGAQLLDTIWPVLVLAGVERVRVQPGLMRTSPLDFQHYPWSHSLLMAAVWGAILAAVYLGITKYRRGAWVLGAVVLSHWFLDWPFHRPDLPLYPGSVTLVGGGLWDSLLITLVSEYGALALGLAIYLRTTGAADRLGTVALWGGILLLSAFYLVGAFAPAPSSGTMIAIGALLLVLFIPWAWWVDRHRILRDAATATALA